MFLAGTMAISLSACDGSDDSKKTSEAKTEQSADESNQKDAQDAQASIDAKYNPNNIAPADYSNTDEYLTVLDWRLIRIHRIWLILLLMLQRQVQIMLLQMISVMKH